MTKVEAAYSKLSQDQGLFDGITTYKPESKKWSNAKIAGLAVLAAAVLAAGISAAFADGREFLSAAFDKTPFADMPSPAEMKDAMAAFFGEIASEIYSGSFDLDAGQWTVTGLAGLLLGYGVYRLVKAYQNRSKENESVLVRQERSPENKANEEAMTELENLTGSTIERDRTSSEDAILGNGALPLV